MVDIPFAAGMLDSPVLGMNVPGILGILDMLFLDTFSLDTFSLGTIRCASILAIRTRSIR
jgi:hypothetical protein